MDHLIVITEETTTLINSLGYQVGDRYIFNENTSQVLDNINRKLNEEDKSLRTIRRALAFSRVVQKDLVPILVSSAEDSAVFSSSIRLFVNLSVPVNCLCPDDGLNAGPQGAQTIFELSRALEELKDAFLDGRATRVIMDWMSSISGQQELTTAEIGTINCCLLLIRNILHIPDRMIPLKEGEARPQNLLMWNLFAQNLDKVLLDLINHANSSIWCTTIVQLIALVYKDQHVENLHKLLHTFLDTSMAESSEDNESNTSTQDQGGSGSVSPVLTLGEKDSNKLEEGSATSTSTTASDDGVEWRTIRKETNSNSYDESRKRRASVTSLEVFPASPSFSDCNIEQMNDFVDDMLPQEEGPEKPEGGAEEQVKREGQDEAKSGKESSKDSGRDSETLDGEPPCKKFIQEDGKNNKTVQFMKSPRRISELCHKTRPSNDPTRVQKGNSGSDSSEITGVPKLPKAPRSGSTDYGYVSNQMETENQASNSSSSTEDDQYHKRVARTHPLKLRPKKESVLSAKEKAEKRRLRLLKGSQKMRSRVKGMMSHHSPSDEDISELLKEFTVDFLLTGYSSLVVELRSRLTHQDIGVSLDISHFLWLLTYFLKFACQLEIGMDQISKVLCFKTLAYVTYLGVELLETVELATRERKDLRAHLRRIHLVVTALRELMNTISSYQEQSLITPQDLSYVDTLKLQTSYTEGLRQLLLLLLRSHNPQIMTTQYLSDLVVCNHMLLLNLEDVADSPNYVGPPCDIPEHIQQFANVEVMNQYSRLLVQYQENPPQVNDYILTMMHHVAGDLASTHTLYIPSILLTFSKILEQGLKLCDDWIDLIEFVIQKFVQSMGTAPNKYAARMVECIDSTDAVDECGLTVEQAGNLFWHFSQVQNARDPVGALIEIYREQYNISLSRLPVIQSLLTHGIITHAQYMNFMYMKSILMHFNTSREGSVTAEVGSEHGTSDCHIMETEDGENGDQRSESRQIKLLIDCLVQQGRESLITWVQNALLDASRVKMNPGCILTKSSPVPLEPVPFHYNLFRQNIPLVPYSKLQFQGLQTEAFNLLLHKLGLLLPADVGKVYPRIPHFWSADHMYAVAGKLGPMSGPKFELIKEEINNPRTRKRKIQETRIDTDLDMLGPGGPGPSAGEMLDILKGGPDRADSPPKAARWIDLASISKASLNAAAAGVNRVQVNRVRTDVSMEAVAERRVLGKASGVNRSSGGNLSGSAEEMDVT